MDITDLSNITEHPSYYLGDKVAEICAPLFSSFPINYFCYTKWRGNSVVIVASDKHWLRYYLQGGYDLLVNGKKIHPWLSNMAPKALNAAALKFNHYNGIMVEKVQLDYIETLEFASPNQYSDPLEFCCNKDLLNQFFLYFKDKADHLIKIVEREPICFSESRFLVAENGSLLSYPAYHAEFYRAIADKKMRFKFGSKDVVFSRREFEVVSLLAKGKSMAEVAVTLQISQRTVETHLYNAKNKADVFTVGRLLDGFMESLF